MHRKRVFKKGPRSLLRLVECCHLGRDDAATRSIYNVAQGVPSRIMVGVGGNKMTSEFHLKPRAVDDAEGSVMGLVEISCGAMSIACQLRILGCGEPYL